MGKFTKMAHFFHFKCKARWQMAHKDNVLRETEATGGVWEFPWLARFPSLQEVLLKHNSKGKQKGAHTAAKPDWSTKISHFWEVEIPGPQRPPPQAHLSFALCHELNLCLSWKLKKRYLKRSSSHKNKPRCLSLSFINYFSACFPRYLCSHFFLNFTHLQFYLFLHALVPWRWEGRLLIPLYWFEF